MRTSAFVDVADGVFVIADGLGGRPAGELASRTAVTSFVARIRQLGSRSCSDVDAVREAVQAVNIDVHRLAEGHPELTGTATTLSAALIRTDRQSNRARRRQSHLSRSR